MKKEAFEFVLKPFVLIAVLLCFFTEYASAVEITWSDDKRLTYTSTPSVMPVIAIDSANNIYAAWTEGPHYYYGWYDAIYFTKMDGMGNRLIGNTNLFFDGLNGGEFIAVDSKGNLHIVAESWYGPAPQEEMYHKSVDSAGRISSATQVTNTPSRCNTDVPLFVIDSHDDLHFVWQDEVNDPIDGDENLRRDIFYKKFGYNGVALAELVGMTELTIDGGIGFGNVGYVNNLGGIALDSEDNLHIVWADWRLGHNEIYFKKIDNSGRTLIGETIISSLDSFNSSAPKLAVDPDDNLHIVWNDYRDGNWEVYYAKLDNYGNVLIKDRRLTDDPYSSTGPSITLSADGNIYVVWSDKRDGNQEIYYTLLDKNGNTLIDDTRLTFASGISGGVKIALDSENNIHLAWSDSRDGNDEIYYKKGTIRKNLSPISNAGSDQILELTSCDGAIVALDGSGSSDSDGDALTYSWTWPGGSAEGVSPTVTLPYGATAVTLTVDDGKGGTSTDEVVITVADKTAPVLNVSLSPNVLWPPNHKYVTVTPSVTVQDACVRTTDVELLSASSNEPDNGIGDGDTVNDIVVNSDGTLSLRAERSGTGSGRTYTITYLATDAGGNSATAAATVTVPHGSGKK